MSEEVQKLVYIAHDGGDKAEKVLTLFALANIGISMESEVTVILFGEATRLAYKGYGKTVASLDRLPMDRLMRDFLDNGGKILICLPCIKSRQVDPSMLVEGVEATTGTVVNDAILEADKVIGW
ncbi:MAG: DsrE family protein [Deltaproteobacteria bacterium]|nr:DsrE family protein [Deltaproteobacteria bacterium]